jgi:CelD/BcsL family acetyltransferase involved in cellulose biosynthesis
MSAVSVFEVSSSDWNKYVNDHPKGSVFHTLEMRTVFEATPGYEPMHIGARDSRGKIVAMLCAVRIKTIGGVFSPLASRSIMFAEPICDESDEGIEALTRLIRLHDRRWNRKTLLTEIRPISAPGAEQVALEKCGYTLLPYCNYVNDLSDGPHVLAAKLKKTKRKIRTAHRRGLSIESENNSTCMDRVYQQIKASYERSHVPLAQHELFKAALKHLPEEMLQIRVGELDGEDVAATVGLVFKDRYFAWYNGTTRPPGISAAAALVWDEIESACRLGLKYYDFGGAGWPNEDFGPRVFKSRFGGQLVDNGRYRKVGSRIKLALATGGYRLLRRVLYSNGKTSGHQKQKTLAGVDK